MLSHKNGWKEAIRFLISSWKWPNGHTMLKLILQGIGVIVLALISSALIDHWGRNIVVLIIRAIGGVGAFLIALEILRIILALDKKEIMTLAYQVALFFLFFGILKLASAGLDSLIWPEGLSAALVNNLLIFWLYWFARKRRIRLTTDLTSEDRARVSSNILSTIEDMKQAKARIQTELGAL